MAVIFHIPGPLHVFAGGLRQVRIETSPPTVRDALELLYQECPGIRDRLINEEGQLREYINIFVGEDNIRDIGDFLTPLRSGSEISIIPAVSGG